MQNAKGRVRVLGGLEASGQDTAFLGAIGPSRDGPVEAPARSEAEKAFTSSSGILNKPRAGNAHMLGTTRRAKEIREEMARHVENGTVSPKADELESEARAVLVELQRLRAEGCEVKESLEQQYLAGGSDVDEIVQRISNVERKIAVINSELDSWSPVREDPTLFHRPPSV